MPNKNWMGGDPAKLREWYQNYRAKNREKLREYNKKYNRAYRQKNGFKNENNWKVKNPEKVYAQRLLQEAVKKGLIIKKPCEVCDDKKAVGHHDDYFKPLEVRWLCKIHHREQHYRCV